MRTNPGYLIPLFFVTALFVCSAVVLAGDEHPVVAALAGAAVLGLVGFATHAHVAKQIRRTLEELRRVARGELDVDAVTRSVGSGGASEAAGEVARTIQRQRDVLHKQQEISRQILDGFSEGLLAIDRAKRVVLSNRRLSEMLNLQNSVEGKLFYEVVRHSEVLRSFDKALRGEPAISRATFRIDGEPREVELRVVPFEETEPISAVGLFIDITRIERLDRVRSEFISDFSHEVRTPLAAMQSALETLESGFGSDEQRGQLLKIVSRQIQRLEQLSHDLADLDRIESGEVALSLEETDVADLIDDVIADFADRAAEAGIWLTARGERVSAEIDPVRIEQVLTNLIDNALKHAPESDQITIETRRREEQFDIVVIDQGTGVSPEDRERIFNRFYRADRSRNAAMKGTGLGLAIAKHLVLRHQGKIRVESNGERGASFVVTLPYHQRTVSPS